MKAIDALTDLASIFRLNDQELSLLLAVPKSEIQSYKDRPTRELPAALLRRMFDESLRTCLELEAMLELEALLEQESGEEYAMRRSSLLRWMHKLPLSPAVYKQHPDLASVAAFSREASARFEAASTIHDLELAIGELTARAGELVSQLSKEERFSIWVSYMNRLGIKSLRLKLETLFGTLDPWAFEERVLPKVTGETLPNVQVTLNVPPGLHRALDEFSKGRYADVESLMMDVLSGWRKQKEE